MHDSVELGVTRSAVANVEALSNCKRLVLKQACTLECYHDVALWLKNWDEPLSGGRELGFVERLSGKIGVLQRSTDRLRGAEYLRLNIITCMLRKTQQD